MAFVEVIDRFIFSLDFDRRHWLAKALVNKGITLGALDRSEDAIAVYDEVLTRFGSATSAAARAGRPSTRQQGIHARRARPQRGGDCRL